MNTAKLIICLVWLPLAAWTQDDCVAYLPGEGAKMTYINYDKKGKEASTTTTDILSVNAKEGTTEFKVHTLVSTGKKKNDYEMDMTYRCEGNKFFIDMQNLLNPEQMAAYKDASLVVKTEDMFIPSDLEPGMELNDGFIEVMVKMDYMTTEINARAFYREVIGKEEVTTPAGTFEAWKIEGNVESKFAFMRVAFRTVEWYVENIGVVKSESYDNKGKKMGHTELKSIE